MDSPGGLPARPKSAAILPTNPRPAGGLLQTAKPVGSRPHQCLQRGEEAEPGCGALLPLLVSSSKARLPTQNAHLTQPQVTLGLTRGSPACSHCGHHWQPHLACAAPSTAQHVLQDAVDLLPAESWISTPSILQMDLVYFCPGPSLHQRFQEERPCLPTPLCPKGQSQQMG